MDEAKNRSQQTHERSYLRNGRQQIELVFQRRNFDQARFFQSFTNSFAPALPIEDRYFHQARHRSRCGVADREGLDHVLALENVAHPVQELHRVNLCAVKMEDALNKHSQGHGARTKDQPDHRPAVRQ